MKEQQIVILHTEQLVGLWKDKVYPDSGDLSEGFNDYTRKNRPANPQHQGNGQDTLELDPQNELDKKEQVLYVMLVREKSRRRSRHRKSL